MKLYSSVYTRKSCIFKILLNTELATASNGSAHREKTSLQYESHDSCSCAHVRKFLIGGWTVYVTSTMIGHHSEHFSTGFILLPEGQLYASANSCEFDSGPRTL